MIASCQIVMDTQRIIAFGFLILVVHIAGAENQPMDKTPAIAAPGKQTYVRYCASCHGVDARYGDTAITAHQDFLARGKDANCELRPIAATSHR